MQDKIRRQIDPATKILGIFVVIKFLLHIVTNWLAGYGIFRDELYYLACSHRLDLGYVDHPPLSIFLLALTRVTLGDSLFVIRLIPALFGAATVLVAGLIVRKLDGGITALVIAGFATIMAPILLAMTTVYSMNCIDIFLWTTAAYLLLRVFERGKIADWLSLGLVIGLGLLNKIGMAWLAIGLFAGLMLTPQRRSLLTSKPYLAALIALILFSPYVAWNLMHDMAHLEFIRNAVEQKYVGVSIADFVSGQLMLMMPLPALVWLAGLFYLLLGPKTNVTRPVGLLYITVVVILIANGHSKPEYLAATYPALFAFGGVAIGGLAGRKGWMWIKYALPALIVLTSAVAAPIALPFLPVQTYIRYTRALGISTPSPEGHELNELHQFYADMHGWENFARTVSETYLSLPPEERLETVIICKNYGEAGALEYYSNEYDTGPIVSPHNSYWYWSSELGNREFTTAIFVGGGAFDPSNLAEAVEQVSTVECQYCIPYENHLPVYILRGLRFTIPELREQYRIFI